jgi:hypothetical protein
LQSDRETNAFTVWKITESREDGLGARHGDEVVNGWLSGSSVEQRLNWCILYQTFSFLEELALTFIVLFYSWGVQRNMISLCRDKDL